MRTNREEFIGQLLKVAMNQMTRELSKSAAKLGLTSQQMLILNYLGSDLSNSDENKSNLAVKPSELEEEFNIRRSTATEILQRMEKSGLVSRLSNPQDARQKLIQLTEKGKAYLPEIKAAMREHDERVLANLTESEIQAVEKFLNNVKRV